MSKGRHLPVLFQINLTRQHVQKRRKAPLQLQCLSDWYKLLVKQWRDSYPLEGMLCRSCQVKIISGLLYLVVCRSGEECSALENQNPFLKLLGSLLTIQDAKNNRTDKIEKIARGEH